MKIAVALLCVTECPGTLPKSNAVILSSSATRSTTMEHYATAGQAANSRTTNVSQISITISLILRISLLMKAIPLAVLKTTVHAPYGPQRQKKPALLQQIRWYGVWKALLKNSVSTVGAPALPARFTRIVAVPLCAMECPGILRKSGAVIPSISVHRSITNHSAKPDQAVTGRMANASPTLTLLLMIQQMFLQTFQTILVVALKITLSVAQGIPKRKRMLNALSLPMASIFGSQKVPAWFPMPQLARIGGIKESATLMTTAADQ
jgi:hypothetical protein